MLTPWRYRWRYRILAEAGNIAAVLVHAVVDVSLSPTSPLGDASRRSYGVRTLSASSSRYEATIPSSRATCASRSASSRRGLN